MRPVAIVFGTRPEIIKLSPVIRLAQKKNYPHYLVHTSQHYSSEMDTIFFKQLGLNKPKYRLTRNSNDSPTHAFQTARMLEQIEAVFIKNRPSCVVVQGDTNSVLAGTLAASKIPGIKLAHIEAGLRSYDRSMPEEINRIACDAVSDYYFTPTKKASQILLGEGVSRRKIFMTGNTIVDALFQGLSYLPKNTKSSTGHILLTLHRQENVDNPIILKKIIFGVEQVAKYFNKPVLFPAHPRTRQRLKDLKLNLPAPIQMIDPVGFIEFLMLEKNASLVMSDSGGVQEEACILRIPCVTLRTTTERPETVLVGSNIIAGHEPSNILKSAKKMLSRRPTWKNPFGDGKAAERIWSVIIKGSKR